MTWPCLRVHMARVVVGPCSRVRIVCLLWLAQVLGSWIAEAPEACGSNHVEKVVPPPQRLGEVYFWMRSEPQGMPQIRSRWGVYIRVWVQMPSSITPKNWWGATRWPKSATPKNWWGAAQWPKRQATPLGPSRTQGNAQTQAYNAQQPCKAQSQAKDNTPKTSCFTQSSRSSACAWFGPKHSHL